MLIPYAFYAFFHFIFLSFLHYYCWLSFVILKKQKNGIPNKRKTELCCQHPLNPYTHLSLVPKRKKRVKKWEKLSCKVTIRQKSAKATHSFIHSILHSPSLYFKFNEFIYTVGITLKKSNRKKTDKWFCV